MHDTRRAILEAIRAQKQATVLSLAEALGISPISVRHHLTSLQAEGLVQVELQRQPIGRPRHTFSLSENGHRHFPNHNGTSGISYRILAERLLDELKATFAPAQVESLLDRMAANVAAAYGALPLRGRAEERLQKLIEILGEEGFKAGVRRVNETTVQAELNCPYVHVGQRHPEVCRIDHTIIRSVLGAEVERTSCVLQGDRSCIFSVIDSPVSAG